MPDTPPDTPPVEPPADPPAAPAEPPPADDAVTLTRAEHDALIADRDTARKAAAAANRTQKERERKLAQDGGKFEELYTAADKRAAALEARLTRAAVSDAVKTAAARLRFRNPALAARLIETTDLTLDVDLDADTNPALDAAQAALVERRLKAAAETDPYLLSEAGGAMLAGAGARAGAPGGGNGNAAMNAMIRRSAGR